MKIEDDRSTRKEEEEEEEEEEGIFTRVHLTKEDPPMA